MDRGAIILVAMTVIAACVVLGLGFYAFSRFGGQGSSRQSVPCCFRMTSEEGWRKGTLRYDLDRLDHYGPGGLSVRPEHRWLRARLDLGMARRAPAADCEALPRGLVGIQVSCRYGSQTFDLMLGQEHYTALRSWLESVPPGWNANVA